MASAVVNVLYVCTGNVCRSAAAEQLLRTHTRGRDDVAVRSAGTGALEGYGIDAPTAAVLRERGIDADLHQGRWLDEQMIKDADLILTATTEHRDQVLRAVPLAMRRTFTMREFARLGTDVPGASSPADAKATIAAVAGQRGLVAPAEPGQDDIGDPFGAGIEAARVTVDQIEPTVTATARLLGLQ